MAQNSDATNDDPTHKHIARSPTGDPRETIDSRKEIDQYRAEREASEPVSMATHDLNEVAHRYAERVRLELGEPADPVEIYNKLQ